jgi:hypothetical protein
MTERICPLMSASGGQKFEACQGEKCEWWNQTEATCNVNFLYDIAKGRGP